MALSSASLYCTDSMAGSTHRRDSEGLDAVLRRQRHCQPVSRVGAGVVVDSDIASLTGKLVADYGAEAAVGVRTR